MSSHKGKKKRIGSRRRVAHQNDTAEPEELPGTDRASKAQWVIPEHSSDSPSLLLNPNHSQVDTQHPSSSEILEDNGGKGSSRQMEHAKDSATEQSHKLTEEVEENMGIETLKVTQSLPAMQDETVMKLSPTNERDTAAMTQIHSASIPEVEFETNVQEETRSDTIQIAADSVQVGENEHLFGTFQSSGLRSHPTVNEQVIDETTMPQKQHPLAANVEIGQLLDNKDLLWQDGVSQTNNLASEAHVDLRDMEPSATSKITNEKNSLGKNTEIENVKQAACFSPTVEQLKHLNFPEHSEEVSLHENKVAHREVNEINDSFKQVEHAVKEDADICFTNPMVPVAICDREKSDPGVKGTEDPVPTQVVHPSDTQEKNVTNTDESQISSTKISDTAFGQVHEDEDQGQNYAKIGFEGYLGGVNEGESLQTIPFEIESQNEVDRLSNPYDKQRENNLKGKTEVLDQRDGNPPNREESQISSIKVPNTALLHEGKDQDVVEVKLSAEGFISGVEKAGASFPFFGSEINTTLESKSDDSPLKTEEETDNSFNPIRSRRKMGSSRRVKVSHRVKESDAGQFYDSPEDVAGNVRNNEPSATIEMSFAEGPVQEESVELVRREMNKLDMPQTDQMNESETVGISDITSSQLLSDSPGHQMMIDQSETEEIPTEKQRQAAENIEREEDQDFFMECGHEQFLEEIPPSEEEEEHGENYSSSDEKELEVAGDADSYLDDQEVKGSHIHGSEHSKSNVDDVTQSLEPSSGHGVVQSEISDTNESVVSVKSTSATTKVNNIEVVDQRDQNASHTEESQKGSTEISDSASRQVHGDENQNMDGVKYNAEGLLGGDEETGSTLQTVPFKTDAPSKSQNEEKPLSTEEKESSFHPMKSRRKMGSSRRHKGRGPAKESGADTFHESSEDTAENISDKDPLETTEGSFTVETGVQGESAEPMLKEISSLNLLSVSPENKDVKDFSKHPEKGQFVEEITFSLQAGEGQSEPLDVKDLQSPHDSELNVPDRNDTQDANASELMLKSISDSVTQQEALNPNDKQEEHPTKEINMKVSDHTDGNASNTEESSQISNTVRPDTTALFQVYEGENQDVKLGAEGFISEVVEAKPPLQTNASEINAPLESQSESNPLSTEEETENSFNPMKSRRKMGSSRKHKGRGPAKESDADTFHESSEDVAENISDQNPLETTERSYATDSTILKEPVKAVMEDTDKLDITQTEGVNDQIKGNSDKDPTETKEKFFQIEETMQKDSVEMGMEGNSWILVQSDSKETPNQEIQSVSSDTENKNDFFEQRQPEKSFTSETAVNKAQTERVQEQLKEDVPVDTSSLNLLSISPKSKDEKDLSKQHENWQFVEETIFSSQKEQSEPFNLLEVRDLELLHESDNSAHDHSDICDTNAPELGVKSIDESASQEDVLNLDDKQQKQNPKEKIIGGLDQTDENQSNAEETQISKTDTSLSQAHEGEDQDAVDVKSRAGGFISGFEEAEASLPTSASEINAIKAQSEDSLLKTEEEIDKDLNPMRSQRKMGSSRRHKGSQHPKESIAEPLHESVQAVAGNITDKEPSATTGGSFAIETAVQEESLKDVQEMDKSDMCQTDQVKESVSVGMSEFTSSNLVPVSSVHQVLMDRSSSKQLQNENNFTVCPVTENTEREEEQELFMECGHGQFLQELSSSNEGEEHDENVILSEGEELEITGGDNDLRDQHKVLNPNEKQVEHPMKDSIMEALDKRDENASNTEESLISNTGITDNALFQVHESKDQKINDVKCNVEGFFGKGENTKSSLQTVPFEMGNLLKSHEDSPLSTEEEKETFNPMKSRRKMGSSRRHKGRGPAKESGADTFHESSEDTAENISDKDPLETPEGSFTIETGVQGESAEPMLKEISSLNLLSVSPENKDVKDFSKHPENWQFVEEITFSLQAGEGQSEPFNLLDVKDLQNPHDSELNVPDHNDIQDENASELILKSISESVTQQEALNPNDKQEEHPTKEINMKVSDHTDGCASNTEESQISNTVRPDTTALFQVHEDEDQDVKLGAEALISGVEEAKSPLQTNASEINAPLESQSESNPLSTEEETENSFSPVKSRRKMGSSRRHKGRGPAKESGTDTFHESSEDAAENISDQNPLETTERSFTIVTGVPTDSTEPMLKEMDTLVLKQVQESIPVGIEDFPASNLLSVSPEKKDEKEFPKQPENWQFEETTSSFQKGEEQSKPLNLLVVTDLQSPRDGDKNVPHHSDIQDTNASELTLKSISDSATQREALSPDDKQEEHPKKEINMKVSDHTDGNASNTEESQISNTMRPDTTALFQVHEGVDQDVKLGAEGFISGVEEAKSPLQTIAPEINAPLESQSESNPLSTEEETENSFSPMKSRRKMGSSRRHKGRGPAKESGADTFHESSEDIAENISDQNPLETTERSFAIETGVPTDSTEPMLKEIDTLVLKQVQESIPVGIEDFPASNLLSVSQENKDEKEFPKQPENWQFLEEITFSSQKGEEQSEPFNVLDVTDLQSPHDSDNNVPDNWDIRDANASELMLKSINDSVTQREALSPDDKQEEHPTKEINMVSDHTDGNASNTEESQVSNTMRPDTTALFQVHEDEDQDVKLGAEGFISGVEEAKSPLQTIAPEINAPLESQSERNSLSTGEETENSFSPMKSRRKMGSSRRHKDRGPAKDSDADIVHESSEDVAENNSDKDLSKTTFATETTILKEPAKTVTEDMDKWNITQTEGVNDQIKGTTPVSIAEFTSSDLTALSEGDPWSLVQSDSREMPNEPLSDYVAKDSEKKERREDQNLPRHTQDDFKYLVSQSLMKEEGVVHANTPETTTEIEYDVEKENMSSPNGKQSAKGEDDEHFKLSTVKDAQPSEGDLNNVYQQEIKPMEVRGADMAGSSASEERTPSQTSLPGLQSPLDSQPQGNPGLHNLRGNKRKLGSSRRIKGSRVAAESPTEPDVANNATSEEVCDTVPFDKMPTETTETDISSVEKDENKELMQVEDTILPLNVGVNTSSPGKDDSLKPKEEGIQMEPDILSHLTGHDTLKLELKEDSAWKGDSDLQSTSYGGDNMGLEAGALDLGQNKEAREKELYTMAESGEESKEEERGDETGVLNLLVSDQKDIGVKHEDPPDEPFSASQIKTETLLLLDVGTEENKMEPVPDSPVDGESPRAEGPQKKDPTQKKRKLGSTRRSQLSRKPEEGIDNSDTKQMDFDADVQHFGTQGEVEEAPQIVSAEVLQNQKAEPPLTTVHEISTDQDLQRKPSSSAPDLISSAENVMPFLSEKPSSIVEEVNRFFQAPDLDDAERHRPGDTLEKQTRQDDINVAQGRDNLEVAAQENKYISEEGDDTEMKSESPNLTNRRRKMGSTRKSLRAARDEEDLHQQQGVKNEATDAVTNADVLPATVSGIQEEEALKAKDQHIGSEKRGEKAEQRPGESPALGQQVEAEHHLVPLSDPLQPDESPGLDAMSESTHERRRRKMGSHRKSHGQETPTETEPWRSLKTIMDESLLENPQEQWGPDNTSQVEEGSNKSLLNITPSETGELSALVTRNKAPQRVAASRNPAVNPSQGHISLADSSTENSYNVVMVGDSGVGKTSFMKRAQSGKFSLDIPSSIGLDTCLWTVLVDGKPVVLQLWDTAGQERFHSITKQVFHRAQAFLLMYDISSSQTFSAIRYWAECIQEGAVENVPIVLVGNKSDHEKRQVTPEAGETLAKEYNFDFMECSAATGDNVVQSLETVARLLTQRAAQREEPLVFLKDTQQKKESGCC